MYRNISSTVVLGDGLLGNEIIKQTNWDYISRKKDGFDITSSSLDILLNYSVVINCIAFTDTYSNNKKQHWDINYKSVVRLANYCNENNIKLVHISTGYVYSNSIKEVTEEDIPVHNNDWYSYTKLLGDSYVQLNENNLIIREIHKPKPYPYSVAWINQIGNFDYTDIIAEIIIKLIKLEAKGVYNVGTKIKTMNDLAKQTNINVEPILTQNNSIPTDISMNLDKLNKYLDKK